MVTNAHIRLCVSVFPPLLMEETTMSTVSVKPRLRPMPLACVRPWHLARGTMASVLIFVDVHRCHAVEARILRYALVGVTCVDAFEGSGNCEVACFHLPVFFLPWFDNRFEIAVSDTKSERRFGNPFALTHSFTPPTEGATTCLLCFLFVPERVAWRRTPTWDQQDQSCRSSRRVGGWWCQFRQLNR